MEIIIDEMRGDVSFSELRMVQDLLEKRDIRRHTKHNVMRQCPDHLIDAFLTVLGIYR